MHEPAALGKGLVSRFAPERLLFRQIVADGGGGDSAFAHGVADLVEADDDVAGGIDSRNAGALVRIDGDAAGIGGYRDPELLAKLGVRVRSQRRIDAVEGVMPLRRRGTQLLNHEDLEPRAVLEQLRDGGSGRGHLLDLHANLRSRLLRALTRVPNVPLATFIAATSVGIIPGTFAFAFLGSGLDVTVLRPSLVYGAGGQGAELLLELGPPVVGVPGPAEVVGIEPQGHHPVATHGVHAQHLQPAGEIACRHA